jgi:hypothetical protein
MKVTLDYRTVSRFLKAARILEQAVAAIPVEERERHEGRGVKFDSERGREAVKRRWQNGSSMQRALKKLSGEAA